MKANHSLCLLLVLLTFHAVVCNECHEDPDEDRDVIALIESRGFKAETHYATTVDGYILAIHRITNPLASNGTSRKPIIVHHGVLSTGADFLIGSPGIGSSNGTIANNLGFALTIAGYDVWLPNSRGNKYSKNHTTLNPNKDKKFWEFTFDEMIKYDLPAVISYIQNFTKQSKVGYIGHSQGTLIMFGLLSEVPKYSDIIEPFIALAPVARVAHIESPIRYIANNPLIMDLLYYKGGSFLLSDDLIDVLAEKVCKLAPVRKVCANIVFLICGFDISQLNQTRLPVYLSHVPAGTSAWNIIHYGQGVTSTLFRKFDYGKSKNMEKYGSETPPLYDLTKITSKHIALLHSHNDWLADPKDVDFLRSQIKDSLILDYKIPIEKWNHLDFVWGLQSGKYVNKIVLDVLNKYK